MRRLSLNGVLVLGSAAFVAVLAEAVVRFAAPQQLIQIRPDVWQPADTVGWLHRPNVNALINTGERTVHVYTDSEGFRVGSRGRKLQGRRVLVLGDSFMEALQVEYEESFAGLLETGLPVVLGEPVVVRNAGVDGWGPSQYLQRARALVPRDDYALVIVAVFVGNDAEPKRIERIPPREPVQRYRFRVPTRLSWGEVVEAFLRPINDALEVRSHLFVLLKNSLGTFRMWAGLSPAYFPREFLKSQAMHERWAITAELCRELSDVAARDGAATLIVLIPAAFQVESDEFERYLRAFDIDSHTVNLDQPTRRLTEELSARGLTVLDALPGFRAAHAAGEKLYGSVDRHLSPAGHYRLADLVMPTAAGLLRKSH